MADMTQARQYGNPPIEEALCEFTFEPSQEWDLTIPGKVHAGLAEEYDGKPREQRVVNVGLDATDNQARKLSYDEGLAKVQLLTEDGQRMVAIGRDVLSIHMLRPYHNPSRQDNGGWTEFLERIEQALAVYWDVVAPKGILRVGVRYINKIVIPESGVMIEEYLKNASPEVPGLPNIVVGFMSRVEYEYEDGVSLTLSQGSINAPANHVAFLLDLDLIWKVEQSLQRDEALFKTNDLRNRERVAFEALITDKARELFDVS